MLSRNQIEKQSRLYNLLANTKYDSRHCVKLRKNGNIPDLRKECISQLENVNANGEPFKSKRLWGDCCKELILSGYDYKKSMPANLVKKVEKFVMNTSPVPTAEINSTDNSSSTTTPYPRANLREMRNTEAEREGMERQRQEMERQRQEMERQQQRQRNNDINKLEQAFKTLTLPTNSKFNITEDQLKDLEIKLQTNTLTNNEFNQLFVKDQLLSLLRKLESGNKTLTPENRSYIQEVINSSKHKRGLLHRIKNKLTGRGGGLTKKKSTTPKRKLNTHKIKSITNKKKLNTRKRKYNIHKKKLNTRKKKSNTHKRK